MRARSNEKENDGKEKRRSAERKDRGARSRSRSTSQRRKKRERSATPKAVRIHIGRLTRNVTKDHIQEIFSVYGTIKQIDCPTDRLHPTASRGFAYVEFGSPDEAETAMKHMDGGQIDGQEITVAPILLQRNRGGGGGIGPRRMSPMRGGGRGPPRWRSPPRFRRRSPPRRRMSPRRRTRSPVRRRRRSNSSDSSR